MKNTGKTFKMAVAMVCALVMAFSLAACGSAPEPNVFQAEHAIITDGSGMWNPVTEVGVDVGGDEPARADGISNISDGSALTWKITSDKATKASGMSQTGVSYRRRKILSKLKLLLDIMGSFC